MTTTPFLGITLVEQGQSGKHITVNEGFVALDTVIEELSSGASITLVGDASGPGTATVVTALQGIPVSTTDPTAGQALVFDGTDWEPTSQPFDLQFFYPGAIPANAVLLRHVAVRAWSLPVDAAGSRLSAGTAATASFTITLAKNGTDIGTAVVAASGTTATFTLAGGASFAAGDVFTATGPATPDATLADVALSLLGTR